MIRGPLGNRAAPILFRPVPDGGGGCARLRRACDRRVPDGGDPLRPASPRAGSYAQFSPANLAECCVRP
ncbi:hypothetical protein A5682_18010 [Mycobacterium mantenii]|nr:hypothetical protein A5682_18010 [Mycobacterium mantenii]